MFTLLLVVLLLLMLTSLFLLLLVMLLLLLFILLLLMLLLLFVLLLVMLLLLMLTLLFLLFILGTKVCPREILVHLAVTLQEMTTASNTLASKTTMEFFGLLVSVRHHGYKCKSVLCYSGKRNCKIH